MINYCLVVSFAPHHNSISLELKKSIYLIGRGSACDVVILDASINFLHCYLLLISLDADEEKYVLKDGTLSGLKSNLGTWVNNRRINIHLLVEGDIITFGQDYPKLFYSKK